MSHNKKQFFVCAVIVLILTALCYACYHEPPAQNAASPPVKTDAVDSPVLIAQALPNVVVSTKPAEAVQANSVSDMPIYSVVEKVMETRHPFAAPVTERMVSLHRIDFSGIYYLPENVKASQVRQIFMNGKPATYTITENGNIDVWESQLKSAVTAVLK